MKKAIIIIGIPGVGKTSLMYKLLRSLSQHHGERHIYWNIAYLTGQTFGDDRHRWTVIGSYERKPTHYAQGTDRLSMGVQPHFAKYVEACDANLLIEGDRLANTKTIDTLIESGFEVRLYVLSAQVSVLAKRYVSRGSNQTEAFIKGRKTKVENLARYCQEQGIKVYNRDNNTFEERSKTLKHIIDRM